MPIADNSNFSANSPIVDVPKEQTKYKSKADFCHVKNLVLGETTWAEASRKGYKVEQSNSNKSRYINSKLGIFWDHQAIGSFNSFYWTIYKEIPNEWEKLGIHPNMSYDAFIGLFKSCGFSIKVLKKPRVELFMGRETLEAVFDAISNDKSIKFCLNFICGNQNGEGATTRSRNSLYSITVDV